MYHTYHLIALISNIIPLAFIYKYRFIQFSKNIIIPLNYISYVAFFQIVYYIMSLIISSIFDNDDEENINKEDIKRLIEEEKIYRELREHYEE